MRSMSRSALNQYAGFATSRVSRAPLKQETWENESVAMQARQLFGHLQWKVRQVRTLRLLLGRRRRTSDNGAMVL